MAKIPTMIMPSTDPSAIEPNETTRTLYSDIMRLIGEVTTEWAMLDHDLIEVMALIAGCSPKSAGVMYFAVNSFSSRIAIIKGLAKHIIKDKEDRDALLKVLEKLLDYGKSRNEIVHSAYVLTISDVENGKRLRNKQVIQRHTFRSERDRLHTAVRAQTGELTANIKNVGRVRSWLKMFRVTYRMPPPSPRKPV